MVSTMTKVEQVTIPEGYKQTEVGVVPEDWLVKTFKEVCTVNQGLQIAIDRRKKFPASQSRIYITIQYINSSNEPEYIDDYSSTVCCGPDDVLMTRTGNTGIVVTGVTGVFHNNFFKIDFDRKNINSKYFVYYLRSHDCQKTILDKAGISTIPDLNHGDFYSILMPIPDIKEQTAIANALSDVDNLIAALETLIAKKSAIKTAAMQQLLTGKKRLPGFAKLSEAQGKKQYEGQAETQSHPQPAASAAMAKKHPTPNVHQHSAPTTDTATNHNTQTARPGYKHTELGEIPEDWEIKTLGKIGESIIGLTYSPNDVAEFGTLVLRSSNVQKNRLAFDNNVFVNMELPDRVIVRENDILVCVRNGSRQLIGKCALIDEKTAGSAFGAFMSIYRTEFSKFVFFQFQSNIIQNQINEVMGATINQITNKDMAGFKIPLPKAKEEQTAIANVLSDMDAELDALQQRLSKTKTIKQGMMQELLTGKTRLV